MPTSPPDRCPRSVATPPSGVPVYCPICEKVPLLEKQAVCSPRCRIQKSMATRAAIRRDRDATIRLLLKTELDSNRMRSREDAEHVRRRLREVLALLEPEKEPVS